MSYELDLEIRDAKASLASTWLGYTDYDRAVREAWDVDLMSIRQVLAAAVDNRIGTEDIVKALRNRIHYVVIEELYTELARLKAEHPRCEWCGEYIPQDALYEGKPDIHLDDDPEMGFCSVSHLEEWVAD